jgi:hypothetical protein
MEADVLLRTIEEARRRLSRRDAWCWGGRLAGLGSVIALLCVLAGLVLPVEIPSAAIGVAGVIAGLIAYAIIHTARRPSPLFAAQVLDHRYGCADRLATAVEILTGRHRWTRLAGVVLDDAIRTAARLDLARRLPGGPDRLALVGIALAILSLVADGALRGMSFPGTPAREVARVIQREGRRLERSAQAMEERARVERARTARRMAPALAQLGAALQRERIERSEALARLDALSERMEQERRQVEQRRAQLAGERSRAQADSPTDLLQQRAAVERAIREISEVAERLAQSKTPEERAALMRQLARLASGDQAGVPPRARQQAETAQRQLAQGNVAGARRTLQQGASELDDLRAMLADEEGLHQAQRDVRRAADQIARGAAGTPDDPPQAPQARAQHGVAAPGDRVPSEARGPEHAEPPAGPHQGTLPGQGTIAEKLGPRTPRLEADRRSSRIEGLVGEGRVTVSDLLGPGRPARVRTSSGPAVAAAAAEADRYIARMRIPPEYREIVRRYFEALAAR